jgi:microcystin-dependent protein
LPFIGSAPNKTFQRTDGTRTGSQTWQEADAAGVDIVSDDHDTHDQDIADGLNQALLKDGGNTATANIPMGGFRFTNLGDAAALTQALTAKQHINNAGQYCSVGGTANVITLSTGFSTSAYAAGQTFSFKVGTTNTGAVTVNVDSLGAKSLVRADGSNTALQAGDLVSGALVEIQYDGTRFQLRGPSTTATSADVLARIVKTGTIVAWAHSTVPAGWLECYGQAISRTTYSELYAAIGTTYGVGDGSTTFNLPDMRGRSIFGEDDMGGSSADRITTAGAGFDGDTLGGTGGAETVTLAQANLPNVTLTGTTGAGGDHTHTMPNATANLSGGGGGGLESLYETDGSASGTRSTSASGTHTHTFTTSSLNGGVSQTAINKMPPAIILKWIILALPAAASASTIGVHGLQYTWNTATSGDPGSGRLLVNNAAVASATALHISETDGFSAGVSSFLATWDDSSSTLKGFIHVSKVGAPGTFAIFSVSGSLTDNGGYDTFTVSHIASAGTLANGDSVSVLFYRTGDKGETGPTGTVSAAGDGTAGAPGIAFASDADTGLYRPGADTLAFATNATKRIEITSTGQVDVSSSLTVGSNTALSEGRFCRLFGTLVRTASGASAGVAVDVNITPPSNTAAEFRSLSMEALPLASGINFAGRVAAMFAAVRTKIAGTMASTVGGVFTGAIIPSDATSIGTVTNVIGGLFQALSSSGNALTSTISNAFGVQVINNANSGSGPLAISKTAGIAVEAQTRGTDNTDLLIGTITIPSGNFAIYSGSTRLSKLLGPLAVSSYTVATVPSASASEGQIIYVSNETGGAVLAFSDGTNWRRVTDRAIIS